LPAAGQIVGVGPERKPTGVPSDASVNAAMKNCANLVVRSPSEIRALLKRSETTDHERRSSKTQH